jgi:hypothetical protein
VVTVNNGVTFDDVPKTSPQWPYVEALVRAKITGGCSAAPRLYCPLNNVTRAQMAVFIIKAMSMPAYDKATPTFEDVSKTHWAYGYIERMYALGVTGGCSAAPMQYCPDSPVTREQMAKFLCLAAGKSPMPSCAGTFGDVTSANGFCRFIERLTDPTSWPGGQAVTSGCAAGPPPLYCPKSNVTRGQMAVFLVRAFGIPL